MDSPAREHLGIGIGIEMGTPSLVAYARLRDMCRKSREAVCRWKSTTKMACNCPGASLMASHGLRVNGRSSCGLVRGSSSSKKLRRRHDADQVFDEEMVYLSERACLIKGKQYCRSSNKLIALIATLGFIRAFPQENPSA